MATPITALPKTKYRLPVTVATATAHTGGCDDDGPGAFPSTRRDASPKYELGPCSEPAAVGFRFDKVLLNAVRRGS